MREPLHTFSAPEACELPACSHACVQPASTAAHSQPILNRPSTRPPHLQVLGAWDAQAHAGAVEVAGEQQLPELLVEGAQVGHKAGWRGQGREGQKEWLHSRSSRAATTVAAAAAGSASSGIHAAHCTGALASTTTKQQHPVPAIPGSSPPPLQPTWTRWRSRR